MYLFPQRFLLFNKIRQRCFQQMVHLLREIDVRSRRRFHSDGQTAEGFKDGTLRILGFVQMNL